MTLYTVPEVAADLKVSEWTVAELVRRRKVDCIRVNTADGDTGPIRFTQRQYDQLLDVLTVRAEVSSRPRRRSA